VKIGPLKQETDARRITAADMKCMRKTAGYVWTDYKTNTDTAKELNITLDLDKIQEYRRNNNNKKLAEETRGDF
jgi:ABC-type ATPase involved in cell division